jgi:predicted SnoaL-like aldol condensation-catalyzing enzyme
MTSNRTIVEQCFTHFAAGDIEFLRPFIRSDFVEHSPGNPSGRDEFLAFLAASPVAKAKLDLRRLIADETHVAVHYRMVIPEAGVDQAVIDIWRLEDGQIVEHWDVVQPVPAGADMF